MPNSQPEWPAGTQAVPSFATIRPSQPARWESSLREVDFRESAPVEWTKVLRNTANLLRATMLYEAQLSMSLALIARNGGHTLSRSSGRSSV